MEIGPTAPDSVCLDSTSSKTLKTPDPHLSPPQSVQTFSKYSYK